jgi:uncharacterized protein (UPF0303 family)
MNSLQTIANQYKMIRQSDGSLYIGNKNTTLANSMYDYPAPYGDYYWSSKHQILILASELLQFGLIPGMSIRKIGLEVTSTNGSQPLNNFYIKMKETSATQMTTTFETGLTTVLNKQTYIPTVGLNKHDVGFNWSGGNLIIEFGHFNGSYTYNCSTKYTVTANNSVTYIYKDGISVENDASGYTTSVNRPNIIIDADYIPIIKPVISLKVDNKLTYTDEAINLMPIMVTLGSVTSYTLTGTLPAGVSFNTSTGIISGRSQSNTTSTLLITANNYNLSSDPVSFTLVFNLTKPVISLKVDNKLTYTDEAINLMPIMVTLGSVTSYTLSGTLPAGVSFNTSTGIISGRSQSNTTSTLLITANNYNLSSDPVSFTLVFNLTKPVISLKVDNKLTYTDEAINLMPIMVTLGSVTSYTLSGTLPSGVSFNTSTGIISGRSLSDTTSTLLITANNYNVFSDPVSFTLVFDESNPIVYIGNFNTTLANPSTSYPAPYGNWYGSSKHQILILASELLQSGMTVGKTINLIGLEVTSTNGSQPLNNFYIKMKETSATQMTTTFETGLTTVLNNQTYTPIVGVNTHAISTFNWSGGNLIIEFGHFNNSYTSNCSTKYTVTTNNSVTFVRTDGRSVENDASGSVSVNRPNIIIK